MFLHRRRRRAMLIRGDLDELTNFVRKVSGRSLSSPKVAVIALHKARLECVDLPDTMRRDSANWLLMRGMSRYGGGPVPLPNEPLPSATKDT